MSTRADIEATFPIMRQLRPDLLAADFFATITRLMSSGFRLAAVLVGSDVVAVAGYRITENLASGRYLYVDDLVTTDQERSHGHGKLLLDWLKDQARSEDCAALHLDSGVQRHGAHRFYLRERLDIRAYHFRIPLA